MNFQDLISGMERFGSKREFICDQAIGVDSGHVREHVILAPWWEPPVFENLGKVELLSKSKSASVKVWNISTNHGEITYLKSGIGAPVTIDAVLALGLTPCKKILFVGSAGALDQSIGIGDIVIPEYSICGDGASRYIVNNSLYDGDVFGEKVYPDQKLFAHLKNATNKICTENNLKWHLARNFSIDTIFAQFSHLDEIMGMGCNVIEMETAAAFRAAKLVNIPLTALFSVSDNTLQNKSLISGRTAKEIEYRRRVRRTVIPQIILEFFSQN